MDLNVWWMLHETSNACTISTIWLFSINYVTWKGLVDFTWGCSVDGAVVILLVSTTVASCEVCNVPIRVKAF
jgi:hypothetical protein